MSVRAYRLGFLGLNTPDVSAMKDHYDRVLGLPIAGISSEAAYLACGIGSHALGIHASPAKGYRHVGLQVTADDSLAAEAKSLSGDGFKAELVSDAFPGVRQAISLQDPDGFLLYLYDEEDQNHRPYASHGVRPDKIGHVATFCTDYRRQEQFFGDALGFKSSDWIEDVFVFMRCNADHHVLNFLNSDRPGLFHFAFELRDWNHIGRACEILGENRQRVIWGPGRHGAGHNIFTYHRDPDGNIVELFCDLDRMSNDAQGYWDPRPHHKDCPQYPKRWTFAESHIWGPDLPHDFIAK
ncbi:VOC family protein [Rhizobium sp. NZLR1]|uniref:VOC family protein n=1 Tax=Rhizobium sp. NZLR1 TaxID=2731096 RepID=UPI001A999FC2|nr:VOC family protein [Rhizobium sp. NZLR1]MBX5204067.1 glyoxalase [Rhizobium sp. NZLR1]QSZ25136.1 VOC family protein [Rhizobium sp. NZLR1]